MTITRSIWPLLAILLAGCGSATDDSARNENASPEAAAESEMPASGADPASQEGAVEGITETADSSGADTEATTDQGRAMSVQETALEYQARKSREAGMPAEGTDAIRFVVMCVNCHGPMGGGNLALRTPRIGGLEAWYIARQLKLFHRGLRGGAEQDIYGYYMRSAILLLDNAGIEELAEHFAALDPEPLPDTVEGDVSHGEELYAVCIACHGEQGEGNAALNTPSLIGQSGPYMVRQLEYYRNGVRGADPADVFGQQMAPIVQNTLTSRQDVVDVVAYIESLNDESAGTDRELAEQVGAVDPQEESGR